MKPGWNPARRNRNIGTKKQGHGRNNALMIPCSWHDTKMFWEKLRTFDVVERALADQRKSLPIVTEQALTGFCHACTPDDIIRICSEIRPADMDAVDFIVLRQPKRKDEILAGCWGRAAFFAEIGPFAGAAVILEAQPIDLVVRWRKSLSPDRQDELDRLREDGHIVEQTQRHYLVRTTPESIRATQLYRTLPHEIGHLVDYRRSRSVWDTKPTREKEVFAHRYATALRTLLIERGVIPFGGLQVGGQNGEHGV